MKSIFCFLAAAACLAGGVWIESGKGDEFGGRALKGSIEIFERIFQ